MSREPVIRPADQVLPVAAARPVAGPVELHNETDPIVWVPDPYDPNKSIPVRRSALTPAVQLPARELAPQPLIDPWAQRALGTGVGAGVAGWGGGHLLAGAGQLLSAAAGAGSFVAAVALLLLVAKVAPSGRGKTVHITNHNRFGGRSHTHVR
ncbi:hypothetical protein HCJ76_43905 [Streptomyces sp. MC1]|uniref:hypothetical protein n=1 Tax=Streptomyces sp. MC1 TaxID=295105 RepID=UPI0018C9D94A|nr:hypothetical protein [Streptomyces sp. MC1]MBG7704828.1 hypothetical protein [Streptomyces sp. MC1]